MTDILNAYTALSASSSRSDVCDVLNSVINAAPFTFDRSSRVELIKVILQDLKSCGTKGKLTSKDAAQALLAVKTLGKDPSGSAYLATDANLSTLLNYATTFKDEHDACSEALRCIANALLLIEDARATFISKGVNGGEACITMLEKSSAPDQIFILSRILFLSTAAGTTYVESVVEEKHHGRSIVDIIASKLDLLTISIRNGVPTAQEAMSDLLKFTFNLLLHYPKLVESDPQSSSGSGEDKVMGDFWSAKLDGLLPPLLRVFSNLPATSPCPIAAPLTHVIHSLITIPVTPALRPVWLGIPSATSSSRNSATSSPKARTPQRAESSPGSRSDSPTRANPSPTSPKPTTLDRALNIISAGRRSLSRSPSNLVISSDIVLRAYDLLDLGFSHYFPGNIDPDEPEVRARCKAESTDTLEDMLSPLVVLITRLCFADAIPRARVRQWVIPDDLDRSSPLEQRSDMLGRCLRLLSSVHHARLKDSVGELLFAMADSDASVLSTLVGYGNVAGYLFHKGILNAPPPSSTSNINLTTPSGDSINPITGTTVQPKSDVPEMSEEEKEREMEKLFVLFDRLEKTGAIAPESNPMRKAIQGGG
ncbi:guanine nucleotide exchange factor [Crassisporium funariophilum]|nr:guanine nucleotide exchange factor [Crassisporium funariophilum]